MTNEIKTYSAKKSAKKAAIKQGIKDPILTEQADGRWTFSKPSPLYNAELRTKSAIEKPVQFVWDLCFNHPKAKRRDIVTMAIEAGVSGNTARTQYQYWRKAKGLVKSPKLV